jgi:hypothetical protein
VGATCRIYRGWPSPAALNLDLTAGVVNVTVFPATASGDVPDAYFDRIYTNTFSPTLGAIVTGTSVTFSGSVVTNQTVGLLVDGVPFSYSVNPGDTEESIAANLAVLIAPQRITMLAGSTLTIPGARTLVARVVMNATVSQGLRRQRREISVNCWCPSPALRDAVCATVDCSLSATSFISLADGTRSHVRYVSTQVYDQSQNAFLYRRDLCYKCEYTMISSASAPVMLFGDILTNEIGSFV